MDRRMPVRRSCLVMACLTAALFSACAAPPRTPVPEALASKAEVVGLPGVRFWGDEASEGLLDWYLGSIDRERDRLKAQGIHALPPTSYLALSGGGPDGAFGAGLLCGWTRRGDRPEFKFVTGVSTGALIAPFAFVGPDYDHVLREVYTTIRTEDVMAARNPIAGLLSDGLTDSAPLRRVIERHVDMAFLARVAAEYRKGRGLIICTTNMDAQRPVLWTMGVIADRGTPEALELFRDVMLASASIPAVFPPVLVDVEAGGARYREMHADGGTTSQVFLYPAAFSFKDIAHEFGIERRRSVYVIRNGKLGADYAPVRSRTLAIAGRAVSTLIKTQGVGDLYRIYLGCQRDGIDYNLAYIPPGFTAKTSEAFDPVYMRALFDAGYQLGKDGYAWAKAPPGFEPPELGRK